MKNDYKICGDYTIIYIDSQTHGRKEAFVDVEDITKIKNVKWSISYNKSNNRLTIVGRLKKNLLFLHRVIMEAKKGFEVDHINHNTFDNRKNNLRISNKSENGQNRIGASKRSTTGIRNVFWVEKRQVYLVQLTIDKKSKFIGHFKNILDAEKEAIKARAKFMPFSQEALIAS